MAEIETSTGNTSNNPALRYTYAQLGTHQQDADRVKNYIIALKWFKQLPVSNQIAFFDKITAGDAVGAAEAVTQLGSKSIEKLQSVLATGVKRTTNALRDPNEKGFTDGFTGFFANTIGILPALSSDAQTIFQKGWNATKNKLGDGITEANKIALLDSFIKNHFPDWAFQLNEAQASEVGVRYASVLKHIDDNRTQSSWSWAGISAAFSYVSAYASYLYQHYIKGDKDAQAPEYDALLKQEYLKKDMPVVREALNRAGPLADGTKLPGSFVDTVTGAPKEIGTKEGVKKSDQPAHVTGGDVGSLPPADTSTITNLGSSNPSDKKKEFQTPGVLKQAADYFGRLAIGKADTAEYVGAGLGASATAGGIVLGKKAAPHVWNGVVSVGTGVARVGADMTLGAASAVTDTAGGLARAARFGLFLPTTAGSIERATKALDKEALKAGEAVAKQNGISKPFFGDKTLYNNAVEKAANAYRATINNGQVESIIKNGMGKDSRGLFTRVGDGIHSFGSRAFGVSDALKDAAATSADGIRSFAEAKKIQIADPIKTAAMAAAEEAVRKVVPEVAKNTATVAQEAEEITKAAKASKSFKLGKLGGFATGLFVAGGAGSYALAKGADAAGAADIAADIAPIASELNAIRKGRYIEGLHRTIDEVPLLGVGVNMVLRRGTKALGADVDAPIDQAIGSLIAPTQIELTPAQKEFHATYAALPQGDNFGKPSAREEMPTVIAELATLKAKRDALEAMAYGNNKPMMGNNGLPDAAKIAAARKELVEVETRFEKLYDDAKKNPVAQAYLERLLKGEISVASPNENTGLPLAEPAIAAEIAREGARATGLGETGAKAAPVRANDQLSFVPDSISGNVSPERQIAVN